MLLTRFKARLTASRPLVSCMRRLSTVSSPEAEYTAEPKYPPIVDPSPEAEHRRGEEKWHDWMKSHPTVEEKLIEINMPKFYGWHSVMVEESHLPYHLLPMAQFTTRTLMFEEETITQAPDNAKISKLADELLPAIKGPVEDAILFHYSCNKGLKPADQLLVNTINRVLLPNLAPSVPHLNDIEISHDPRLEAFWFVGGVDDPPIEELEYYFRQEFYKDHKPFTKDRAFQYRGQPILQVRSQNPLPPVVERESSQNPEKKIEDHPWDPSILNFENKYRHGVTLPGFWAGSHYEFGLFSFQSRKYIDARPPHYEPEEHDEAAHASAIFSSYSWLYGQACFQGFSTFHDVTYPLVTQTALTDGRVWSFYLYQLNTTLVHHEFSQENKYHNMCWGTKAQELYKSVEDGRIIGFNDDVLKQIMKMYLLAPCPRADVAMKPYLGEKPLVHQIDFEERRAWLHANVRHLMANKPSNRLMPEATTAQKIFLTFFPLDRVKKSLYFFQLGIDPHDRRLDDHALKYRPKALRTRKGRKKCQRFYKNYYPGTNLVYDPYHHLS